MNSQLKMGQVEMREISIIGLDSFEQTYEVA